MRLIIRQIRIREGTRRKLRIDVDWRSSRLSALPLMCRTAFAAVALALLAVAGVESAQATQPARTQRRPSSAAASHAAKHPALTRSAHQTPGLHLNTHSGRRANLSATGRKRTPDEVGRTAGLAIRRQLARRQMGRGAASVRIERSRNARRLRLERIALRSTEPRAARGSDSGAGKTADLLPDPRQPETDEAENMESRRLDGAREAIPATNPVQAREPEENADVETAPTDRAATQSAPEKDDDAARDGDEGAATAPSQPRGAADRADAASGGTNDEEASLHLPRRGMPAPLRGSLASLERQNDRLDAEGLERIDNEADLAARIADKLLVPIPASSALTVNAELEENHRYCRPWTAKFLADLARAHEAAFHRSIEVSSAVRTVEYQKRLMETNGNAAPAEGDLVSPHLTGATIDIAKSGLSRGEIAWMRRRLAELEAAGKIDVEEEFKQACFHITVYKNYVPGRKAGEATPAKPAVHSNRKQTADPAAEPKAQGA